MWFYGWWETCEIKSNIWHWLHTVNFACGLSASEFKMKGKTQTGSAP